MSPIEFSIHYSPVGAYEEQALALARRLFAVYDTGIDSLSLVPNTDELFALYFNDQLISSYQRDGRAPTVADVRALFRQQGVTVALRPGPEQGLDQE